MPNGWNHRARLARKRWTKTLCKHGFGTHCQDVERSKQKQFEINFTPFLHKSIVFSAINAAGVRVRGGRGEGLGLGRGFGVNARRATIRPFVRKSPVTSHQSQHIKFRFPAHKTFSDVRISCGFPLCARTTLARTASSALHLLHTRDMAIQQRGEVTTFDCERDFHYYKEAVKLPCQFCGIKQGGTKAYIMNEKGACYCCWRKKHENKPIADPKTCGCMQHVCARDPTHPYAHVFAK